MTIENTIREMTDSDTGRVSGRRSVLLGAGALAAGAAANVLATDPASANDGNPLNVGQQTNAESTTVLYADGSNYGHGMLAVTDTAFSSIPGAFPQNTGVVGYVGALSNGTTGVAGSGPETGVYGSGGSTGVHGIGNDVGVWGEGATTGMEGTGKTGVFGIGSTYGVTGQGPTGVYGMTDNGPSGLSFSAGGVVGDAATDAGVIGLSSGAPGGYFISSNEHGVMAVAKSASSVGSPAVSGVVGMADAANGVTGMSHTKYGVSGSANAPGGAGVNAVGTGGAYGLKVSGSSSFAGVTTFSRSGKLTISSGATTATKTGIGLGSNAMVMATIQGAAGNAVSSVTINSTTSFTVNLLNPASGAVTVAWFVVN